MAGVSPPPHDALDPGHALMEAMRGTAVSFPLILIVASSCDINASIVAISCTTYFLQLVQLPVKVEHFYAAMVNESGLLTAVMEFKTALMAVMRLDVVYWQ